MIYDNMEEWEVVHAVLHNNPAGRNVKHIAAFLGISPSVLYKYGQDPEFSGFSIPKDKILPLSHYTKDIRLMGFYLYQLGYRPEKIERGSLTNGEIMDDLMRMDRWRGVLADMLLDVMRDGKLDKEEIKNLLMASEKIREEISNFQEELRIKLNVKSEK